MSLANILPLISVYAIPLLFAITLHEVAHGRVALFFGDKTASMLGRLSLNPLKHVDPIGTVIVPLGLALIGSPFLFGWAKPVPVDPRNLRHPKRDMAWVAAAGPAANIAMALVWSGILALATHGLLGHGTAADWLALMGKVGVGFNVALAVFNMLPIPPLDGGRVAVGVLPMGPAQAVARVEPYGLWILIALLWLNSTTHILDALLLPLIDGLAGLIERLFA